MKKLNMMTSCLAFLAAFDNGSPGWKIDANGALVLKDGNPVYVDASGQEKTVGADTIKNLNAEAKTHREAKESAEAKLKNFEGLDPEKARTAIETMSKIDQKKLIDAGEVDKVTDQIKAQFTAQLGEKDTALSTAQKRIDDMLVSDVFKSSEFVREGVTLPRDIFEDSFRKYLKVEDGKIVAYGKDGNKLLSKSRAGEYADPEEALQLLVESHPQKDTIMKANPGNGTGNNGGGGNRGAGRIIKRSDLEKMTPVQKADSMAKVRAGEMQLTE